MGVILSSLAALFFAVALLMLGSGLLGIFLSVRMTLEAFPTEVTGLMISAFYGGWVAGTLSSAKVIHRVGHIRAFTAFAGVVTASVIAHALLVSPYTWIPLRALTGFNLAGVYMVIESWLNERATSGTRGSIFSIYQITSYSGLGVGQFLLNVADPAEPTLLIVAALLFSLCLVPVALTRAVHPAPFESGRFQLKRLFKRSPLGMVACAGAGLVTSAFYGLGPVFALNAGFGVTAVSAFMGVTILGGLALQWPVGRLSDRHDRRLILGLTSLTLTGVTTALIVVGNIGLPIPLGLAALFGGCMSTLYPLAVAHANDLVDPQDFVPASAALLFVWGLGAAVGPVLAALTMGQLGPQGLFVFTLLISVFLTIFAYFRRAETVPVEEQLPYANVPRTSPAVSVLDPRAPIPSEDVHAQP